nr:MAG: hypothetical protein CM15mV30_1080 [uncultured marine virus]
MSEIDEKKNKIEDLDERLEELENKIQNIEDILDIQTMKKTILNGKIMNKMKKTKIKSKA